MNFRRTFNRLTGWRALLLLLVCAGLLISACAREVPVQKTDEKSLIALMPFIKGRDPQNLANTLSCPFERFCYEDDALASDAHQVMTQMLQGMLLEKLDERALPLKTVRRTYEALLFDHPGTTPLKMAQKLGKELGVDYVLVGNVWRFRERVGSSLGVAKPASVAFSLYLVDTQNGKSVWQDRFNETQQSLSENLLKAPDWFKRGGTWLKARELARYGLKNLLEDLPLK
ncbi:MAG TPA: hypothetical protein VKN73_11110 [Desulfosalsimonadaceae bacterium]|nr:hypothetical protein [Desulfosalsimonadaceae bacterium]